MAHSLGLSREELDQLTRFGLYKRPINGIAASTDLEIEALPVSFGLTRFKHSDKVVLLRSQYLGKDYTGRNGNYFSHALVGEALRSYKAYHLIDWLLALDEQMCWVGRVSLEEEEELSRRNLEPLEPDLNLESLHYFDRAKAFIKNSPQKREKLSHLIDAILAKGEKRKTIILIAEKEELLLWILLLHYSFPSQWANKISFNSYRSDYSRGGFQVVGLLPENSLHLSEMEKEHTFFYFDMTEGKRPLQIPETRYAKAVLAYWKSKDKDDFLAFLGALQQSSIGEDFDPNHPYLLIVDRSELYEDTFLDKTYHSSSKRGLYNFIELRFGREVLYEFCEKLINRHPRMALFRDIYQQVISAKTPDVAPKFYKAFSRNHGELSPGDYSVLLQVPEIDKVGDVLLREVEKLDVRIDPLKPSGDFELALTIFKKFETLLNTPNANFVGLKHSMEISFYPAHLETYLVSLANVINRSKGGFDEQLDKTTHVFLLIFRKNGDPDEWMKEFLNYRIPLLKYMNKAVISIMKMGKADSGIGNKEMESLFLNYLLQLILSGHDDDLKDLLIKTEKLSYERREKVRRHISHNQLIISEDQIMILNKYTFRQRMWSW
ncbi:MAG: hypothetical protein Roseis2KO_41770 [Roseivirga sp.]